MKFTVTRCSRAVFMAFSLMLGGGSAYAGDKEERTPRHPSFDPLATLIVYEDHVTPPGELLSKSSEIWTVFPDGLGKMRLTTGHKDAHPRFSPDGKQIIFERDLTGEIWIMSTLGGTPRNLTNTPNAREESAHFSNDGESVFMIAEKPLDLTDIDIAKEPLLALGSEKVVVQLNLKDGTRRELLSSDYWVREVIPESERESEILVLGPALEASGKPSFGTKKAVLTLPLNGGNPTSLFSPSADYEIESVRSGGEYLFLSGKQPGDTLMRTFLLKKAKAPTATPADIVLLDKIDFMGDISCDGRLVVGTGLVDVGRWAIITYDIAANKWFNVLEERG